jgi:DedD protein
MAASQDTEITLGTGKMLVLFFGLVALCAVFFGMGFSLGKSSRPVLASEISQGGTNVNTTVNAAGRPSAVKPTNVSTSPSSDLSFYKAVGQKDTDAQLTPAAAGAPATAAPEKAPTDPMVAPPTNGYYVQVAAVSKQDDAEALVDALKKKQYAAFTTNVPPDKLFHVQVGPFADVKDAESTRAKLVSDGYNPILKK